MKPVLFRFLNLFFIICLTLVLSSGICYIIFNNETGLLMFKILGWIFLLSAFSCFFWYKKYKNFFEAFLVSITCFSVVFSFVIFAPCAIERSLSVFIFFYANEKGSITQEAISSEYISSFVAKRFNDGVESYFLRYENGIYYPTYKTKAFYWIYYPLGKITNTLDNYRAFKDKLDEKNRTYEK